MKILILMCLLVLTAQAEINVDRFLEALAMKETGLRPDAVGPCGELSRWQITRDVWREEMGREPFANAWIPARARECTLRHLARIRRLTGDSVERLATCWHYGIGHRGRASVWGQYVENLYNAIP